MRVLRGSACVCGYVAACVLSGLQPTSTRVGRVWRGEQCENCKMWERRASGVPAMCHTVMDCVYLAAGLCVVRSVCWSGLGAHSLGEILALAQ